MNFVRDWLWDRKIGVQKARSILRNPKDKQFLALAGVLLSRKNTPQEVFRGYLKPQDFLMHWSGIKRQMRKDSWNEPRIEYWQAIYEKLKEKYERRGIVISKPSPAGAPQNEFCKSIADKLRMVRKAKGLTQGELAKRLKISQQMISRIEQGRENISMLTLKGIVDSLEAKLQLEVF